MTLISNSRADLLKHVTEKIAYGFDTYVVQKNCLSVGSGIGFKDD